MGLPKLTGTYRREDVLLLLDETGVAPEPEYMPSAAYRASVERVIEHSAAGVAQLCATLGDRVLKRRGKRLVLVSIVRAGVPIGVLVKRWLALRYGIVVPHYGVSVAAGVVDEPAVRWICRRRPAGQLQFLDAWTSKGAVQQTLRRSARQWSIAELDPSLAVLTDPGCCARLFATREDVLLPNSCLGAAMSGLLSATTADGEVRNSFHRATTVWEAGFDLTTAFLAAATIELEALAASPATVCAELTAASGDPPARGCDHALTLARRHRAASLELVNVGICETTRAFFRRAPTLVIVNPRRAGPELAHLVALAQERKVSVAEDADLPFQAALI